MDIDLNAGQETNLQEGGNDALLYTIDVQRGPASFGKKTFQFQITGATQIVGWALHRDDGTGMTQLTGTEARPILSGNKLMAIFVQEEVIQLGTPHEYLLEIFTSNVSQGDTLTVTLLDDAALPASLVGLLGYIFRVSGIDSIVSTEDGLCDPAESNMVVSDMNEPGHTYPTVDYNTCIISDVGTPDFTNGASTMINWGGVIQNTLAAP